MPNRFTAIPARPVPPPGWLAAATLPLADGFMRVMLSRPAGGSLRTTWVTPATAWLVLATCGVAAALAAVLAARAVSTGAPAVIGATLCAAYAVGAAAVLVVALDQRRRST